ncbi:MAG TPA: glycogen-debranching protein, partial [Methylibium sp.]
MPLFRNLLAAALLCAASAQLPATAAINAYQLGAKYDATQTSITFNIYSSRASRVELWLYTSQTGVQEAARVPLSLGANNIWTTTLSTSTLASYGITGTVYYGYRAWGPNWTYDPSWTKGSSVGFVSDVDSAGNRFNPNKLLIDPYALELSHDPLTTSMNDLTVYASGASYRNIDNGSVAPKSIVLTGDSQSIGTKPTRAFKDDVVYEVHVRGLTMNDSSVASAYQGTYQGAAQKAAYLAGLGVTAVEFLPVQETQNDNNDVNPTSSANKNYWGY